MPLGLEDKRVPNGHLTASTYYNHHLSPWHGRLNHRWSWSVRLRRVGQWFQVNFVELMRIKGVATQGRQDANQWVKSYTVSYSVDGMNFVPYKENGRVRVSALAKCIKSRFPGKKKFIWRSLLIRQVKTPIKNKRSNCGEDAPIIFLDSFCEKPTFSITLYLKDKNDAYPATPSEMTFKSFTENPLYKCVGI